MPFFVVWKLHDAKQISAYQGFHMFLTTQQPKGQCVWGARAIIQVNGKHFAEKLARRIALPNGCDFFAESGGGGAGGVFSGYPIPFFLPESGGFANHFFGYTLAVLIF